MTFSNFLALQGVDIDIKDEFAMDFPEFDGLSNKVDYISIIDALDNVSVLLENHLDFPDNDNEGYIKSKELNSAIGYFLSNWKNEIISKPHLGNYAKFFVFFNQRLPEIQSLNGLIEYETHKMRSKTDFEEFDLKERIKEFLKGYEEFKITRMYNA
jgi:hypothetical protein